MVMRSPVFLMLVLATPISGLVASSESQAAVLCRRKTGAVFVRNACQKKEVEINLNDFLSGSGGGGGGGGGGTGLDAEIDQSGSRLRVRYFAAADGSREFIGFFDSQRSENCSFTWGSERAADATIRCFPYERMLSITDSYFQDASCTQPVRLALTSQWTNCPPPVYAAVRTSNQCPTMLHVYDLGPQFQGSVYSIIGSLGCRAVALPAGYIAYTVGNEVSPAAFVEASEQVE